MSTASTFSKRVIDRLILIESFEAVYLLMHIKKAVMVDGGDMIFFVYK